MKKIIFGLLALLSLTAFVSCNDSETYADQKKKERQEIQRFLNDSSITVISEATFKSQGNTTRLENNEFVLFESTGVYMQIVRQGCGEKIKDGETVTVLCRFTEFNIATDSIQLSNDVLQWSSVVDKMTVSRALETYTASFLSGQSVMYSVYGSASVPSGWLVPLAYVNIGRPVNETDEIAKVNLIVPHTQGQAYATQNVYPCYYTITYERGR